MIKECADDMGDGISWYLDYLSRAPFSLIAFDPSFMVVMGEGSVDGSESDVL